MAARKNNSGYKNNTKKRKSYNSGNRRRSNKGTDNSLMPVIVLAIAVFLFLCNFGFIGLVGNSISNVLFGLIGGINYALPVLLFADMFYRIITQGKVLMEGKRVFLYLCLVLLCIALDMGGGASLKLESYDAGGLFQYSMENHSGGGIVFGSISYLLNSLLDRAGTILLMLVLAIISIIFITEGAVIRGIRNGTDRLMNSALIEKDRFKERQVEWREDARIRREEERERREALQEQRREERRIRQQQREEDLKRKKELEEQDQILRRMDKKVSGVMQDTLLKKEPQVKFFREVARDLSDNEPKAERTPVDIHEIVMDPFSWEDKLEKAEEKINRDNIQTPTRPDDHDEIEKIRIHTMNRVMPEHYEDNKENKVVKEKKEEPIRPVMPKKIHASALSSKEEINRPKKDSENKQSRTLLEEAATGPVAEKITKRIVETIQDEQERPTKEEISKIGLSREKIAELEAEIAPLAALSRNKQEEEQEEDKLYKLDQNVPWKDSREDFKEDFEEGNTRKPQKAKATTNWLREEEKKTKAERLLEELNNPKENSVAADLVEGDFTENSFLETVYPETDVVEKQFPKADSSEKDFPKVDFSEADSSEVDYPEEDSAEKDFASQDTEDLDNVQTDSPAMDLPFNDPSFHDSPKGEIKEKRPENVHVQPKRVPQKPKEYLFPKLEFLQKGDEHKGGDSEEVLRSTARNLKDTLETFGVKATITDISQGPSVTRFELQPEPGVKVSKIVGLTDDIKLNLAATDVRIEAPIPGKRAVGIEVPNRENTAVLLRELLESPEFKKFPSRLAFAVGKDIGGKTVVHDIAKMPHVLIAGATGSGKSVCINTLIMSILYKARPDEVKLIMIDPKVVELSIYNGIPHLMIPVVTDPKKATAALQWAVAEMDDRYRKFAELHVRDLKSYNAKISERSAKGEDVNKMPQIVVIVDELADLMMVASADVEASICRLAQLARAAGIHLIIATQRPSVDVITGLIKANMPSRIAFAVSSGVDSRTILDMVGAEKLLGKGDMLFYPTGYPKPVRVQGAFVSDDEIGNVVDYLKNQEIGNIYESEVEDKIAKLGASSSGGDSSGNGEERDELFEKAARLLIEKDKASIGYLQRSLKIGFNRAARIMDQLSEAEVVGPEEGTKPRKILMSQEQFDQFVEEVL